MSGGVSFKVYMNDEEDSSRQEVRRFAVDSDVVTNFTYLREKLQSIFPSVRGKLFTITWKDSDGDDVVISSDEELQIALFETSSEPVRKLYITVNSDYSSNEPAEQGKPNQTLHFGVVCDGCDKSVVGFRFKCIQCPDYDLCSACEAQGIHGEHCMLRIVSPLQWRPHYGKRLAHHMKFLRKSPPKEEESKSDHHGKKGHHGSHHGRSHHGRRGPSQSAGNCSWIDTFASYLNEWANLPGECPMKNSAAGDAAAAATSAAAAAAAAAGAAAAKCSEASKAEQPKVRDWKSSLPNDLDMHVELLKKVGQNLAQFLDPMGIDINVQETPSTSEAAAGKKPAQTPAQSPATQPSTPKGNEEASSSKKTTPVPEGSASPAEKVSENEDWTIIGPNAANNGAIPKNTASPSAPEESVAPQKPLYPELPKPEPPVYHPNPKIQKAVETMIQMGFTNEGGWLTNLLVAKDGDIVRALDALQRNG